MKPPSATRRHRTAARGGWRTTPAQPDKGQFNRLASELEHIQQLREELELERHALAAEHRVLAQTQRDLEDNRDRYIQLYDFAPVGVATLSEKRRVLNINSTGTDIFELPREYILGKPLPFLFRGVNAASFLRHLHQAQRMGHAQVDVTYLSPRRGGRLLEFKTVAINAADGTPGCRTVFHDVTEARLTARVLAAAHAQLSLVTDAAPILIARCSRDMRYLFVNRPLAEFLGRPVAEILGQPIKEILGPRAFNAIRPHIRKVLAGRYVDFEREIPYAGVGRRFMRVCYRPERDASHQVVGWVAAITDITDRRRAEEALRALNEKLELRVRQRTAALTRSNAALHAEIRGHRRAERALRKSEHEINDFFTQSPLALFWIGIDGRIQRVNRAGLELLQRPAEECHGQPIARFLADSELGLEALSRLADGLPLANFRARIRTRHGEVRHVLIDANGLWERGVLKYSRWFVRDVTHRVELEREILAISEREQQRLGQDLHDDLCQRLSGIEYLSQALAGRLAGQSGGNRQRAQQIARMVRESIQHTRDLARGLAPVNLDEGGLTGALRALAARTQKIFHIRCRLKSHRSVSIPDPAVGVHLYRIAQEAVSNAIKHGRARRIDISLNRLKENVMLAVRDNGLGIPVRLRGRKGMGLRVMQYRAGLIQASLVVQRQQNGGTSVVCLVKGGAVRQPDLI